MHDFQAEKKAETKEKNSDIVNEDYTVRSLENGNHIHVACLPLTEIDY